MDVMQAVDPVETRIEVVSKNLAWMMSDEIGFYLRQMQRTTGCSMTAVFEDFRTRLLNRLEGKN